MKYIVYTRDGNGQPLRRIRTAPNRHTALQLARRLAAGRFIGGGAGVWADEERPFDGVPLTRIAWWTRDSHGVTGGSD